MEKEDKGIIFNGYIIRRAQYDEIDNVMSFIRCNWNENHIMAHDREYFEFEFVINGRLNFVIALNREGNIVGCLGWLPCSLDKEKLDIFGSIWIVTVEQQLGIKLDEYMRKTTRCRNRVGVGLNKKTAVPMVRFYIGDKVAKMKQYFIVNPLMKEFFLIDVDSREEQPYLESEYSLEIVDKYTAFEELYSPDVNRIPFKDMWYYKKKYFHNPRRKYNTYAISKKGKIDSFIITRDCIYKNSKALRIVDFCGDINEISYLGASIRKLICDNSYEYVDFYCFGIEDSILRKAGFSLKEDYNHCIVPNYYEPFEKQNVDIWCRYRDNRTVLVKADGDQDRANQI